MSKRIELTKEQEEKIVGLYQSGVSKHKLYQDYKIPFSVTDRVLDKYGVIHRTIMQKKMKELSDEEVKKIINLYQNGTPLKKMPKVVGYSAMLCKRILTENEIPLRIANSKDAEKNKKGRKMSEIIPGEPIDCDTEGQKCIYRAGVAELYLCDYCGKNKKSRGGSPHECTKYVFKTGGKRKYEK